jgi:formate dehydrogenase iron-sulfur subunit
MKTKIYVPCDTTAVSIGADRVAIEMAARLEALPLDVELIRNGSRGMFWLEPLVEVETSKGRVAYGPVTTRDIDSLFAAKFWTGADHALFLGRTEDISYLRQQERLTFERVGLHDPLCLSSYADSGGWRGLEAALSMSAAGIVEQVTISGLRGRGGAAFPTGIKWQTVLETASDQKYIVCNADEGDSGTFADRMLMEGDPYSLIEGMVIAGLAVGATQGFIYLRSEYPRCWDTLNEAIRRAYAAGWLGATVGGSPHRFELEVRLGAGSYICGEETALLESLEGKRGEVRAKPPLPAHVGLFGRPTVVNNVITLGTVPWILSHGGQAYHDFGSGRSRGTLTLQLSGNVQRPGLIEKAFGMTLQELLHDYGGGSLSGRPIRAVQAGGPLGAYIPAKDFDLPLDYEAFQSRGAMLGHGGVVTFDETVDMRQMARFAMEFCAEESCGKCTPCRIGSVRGVEVIDRIQSGQDRDQNLVLLENLCDTMQHASLCAMGGMTPFPVLSALRHFPEDFES